MDSPLGNEYPRKKRLQRKESLRSRNGQYVIDDEFRLMCCNRKDKKRTTWSHNRRNPLVDVISFGASRTIARRVQTDLSEFLLNAFRAAA